MKHKVTVLIVGWIAIVSAALAHGQAARPQAQASPVAVSNPSVARVPRTSAAVLRPRPSDADVVSAAKQRALLDQYCVVCHNDKLKTANLSLEKLDLTTA